MVEAETASGAARAKTCWFSNPLFAPLFGPIPVGGTSKDWLESRWPV
jgi:hypothetical protein